MRRMEAALNPRGDGEFAEEFRIVRPDDGDTRWVFNHCHTFFAGEGHERRAVRNTGVIVDITERKAHEEHADLLMREVNHRSKNMLSLVQVIARQTVAHEPKDFVQRFEERVLALAASQDLLINSGWKGVELEGLVRAQLAHFQDLLGTRISIEGPMLTVNAATAQALGLALHELATNAGKYGALSNAKGMVQVRWTLQTDGDQRRFAISWKERGGPKVSPPGRDGFGMTVISKMSRLSLDAKVEFDLAEAGLTWRLDCAAERVLEKGETMVEPRRGRRTDGFGPSVRIH